MKMSVAATKLCMYVLEEVFITLSIVKLEPESGVLTEVLFYIVSSFRFIK